MMQEDTVDYESLTDAAQAEIDEDVDAQRIWYAKPDGDGYEMHSFPKELEDLHDAQGGQGEGWMRVVFP